MKRNGRLLACAAVASILTLITAACSGTTGSGGSLHRVQVMMFPGVAYRLPVVIAQQQGYFQQAGIDLQIVAQPNNLQGMQAISATKSDIGMISATTLGQGFQAGTQAKLFCGGINVVQTSLVAKKGSGLPSTARGATWQDVLKSLSGKKIGIQTPVGSGLQLLFAAALKDAGATNVTYVNVGGSNSVTQASLDNGSVDVAQSSPTGTQALTNGGSIEALAYLPQGPSEYKDLYGSGWVASDTWLDQNPALAKGFCDATAKGLAFIKDPANKAATAAALQKDTGVDQAIANEALPTYGDYTTAIDNARMTETFQRYVELGVLKPQPVPDVAALVDDGIHQ